LRPRSSIPTYRTHLISHTHMSLTHTCLSHTHVSHTHMSLTHTCTHLKCRVVDSAFRIHIRTFSLLHAHIQLKRQFSALQYTHTPNHSLIHTHTHTHTHLNKCVFDSALQYTHARTHTHSHMHTHLEGSVCIHIHTHKHTLSHTHLKGSKALFNTPMHTLSLTHTLSHSPER